jgi:hypothetical protein
MGEGTNKPMSERDQDEYWNADFALGEGLFYNERYAIRLSLHQAEETYYGRQEIFPLSESKGGRRYFHAKPYILLPDLTVRINLHDRPRGEVVGETEGTDWEGMRHEVLGNAQAWYYPKDKAVVLWGFERVLLERSPDAQRLYATWEDIYDRPIWRRFLTQQEYQRVDKAAFLKELTTG